MQETSTQNDSAAAPRTTPAASGELAALIDSGGMAKQIVNNLHEAIIVLDRELRYRLWNPLAEKITGQPATEVLGRRAPEVHSFVKDHGIDKLIERALSGLTVSIPDFAFSQKRTNWTGVLSGQVAPFKTAAGEIVGAVAVLHDITRRKRMEEASLANLQRYRELFDENPQPMWVHDVESLAFLAVNEAAIRHYGFSREEFLFMTLNDVLAPAETADTPRGISDSGGGADQARTWRHKIKGGRIIDVEINSHVVTFARRRAVLVVANDVTERHLAEQQLRESEAKHRALIEAADVAIFLSEAETGRILEANRRSEQLLGLPRNRIVGLTLAELSPPELALVRSEPPTGPLATSRQNQAYVWHRAGRRIPVDVITSTFEIGGRKLVQSIYRDITKRKRAEDALSRRTAQLEVLSKASRQINAVLETSTILRELTNAAMELVDASGGLAGLLVDGVIVVRDYCLKGRHSPLERRFGAGQGVMGYVMASRLSYCSNEPLRDPLILPEMQRDFGLRNLVCVPILSRTGELLGCVEVHNTRNDKSIEAGDLSLLEMLASVAAVALDNTRMIEARLRVESRYARLVESVVDVIWSIDPQFRFTDLTPSAQVVFGYAPEELIGEPILRIMASGSADMVKAAVARGFNKTHLADPSRWPRLMEIEQVRKDGSRFWAEAKVRPAFDSSGNLLGFTGVSRDVTERKQGQAALERAAALSAATLESVPDGVLVVDRNGRMTSFNKRFLRMWNIPQAVADAREDSKTLEVVLAQLRHPSKFLRKVRELYVTPEVESRDLLQFKDGRVFERFSTPQRVNDEFVGRVWCFREVSPRRKPKEARGKRRASSRLKPRGPARKF